MTALLADGALPFRYDLFGSVLASQVALPLLVSAEQAEAAPSLQLRLGAVPSTIEAPLFIGPHSQISTSHYLHSVPPYGRLLITRARTVLIEPNTGIPDAVLGMLRGAALAHLSLMRGQLPLHASGICHQGRAVIFLGSSGAGKSTLAAALLNAGVGLIADDICHVRSVDGQVEVWPLLSELRLWAESVQSVGWGSKPALKMGEARTKFHFSTEIEHQSPLPLRHIYVLAGSKTVSDIVIKRLTGAQAVHCLLSQCFGGVFMRPLGREAAVVRLAMAVVEQIPIFRLQYPKNFAQLPILAQSLLRLWDHGDSSAVG